MSSGGLSTNRYPAAAIAPVATTAGAAESEPPSGLSPTGGTEVLLGFPRTGSTFDATCSSALSNSSSALLRKAWTGTAWASAGS